MDVHGDDRSGHHSKEGGGTDFVYLNCHMVSRRDYKNWEMEMAVRVNGYECKSLIAIAMESSKSYQSVTNASLCLQILLNNIGASVELMSEISHFSHP